MKPKRLLYGICRDGLIYTWRSERFGCTGILRWGDILNPAARIKLWREMEAGLELLEKEARTPSRNALKRARRH